jgi:putative endonuclease
MSTAQQQTGQYGEKLAADYLRKHHYEILETNWHCTYGEIDIIARFSDQLIFVEVRTHHAANTESAFASITPKKREKMIRAAYAYLQTKEIDEDTLWRIDMIAIALPHKQPPIIDHLEDALGW